MKMAHIVPIPDLDLIKENEIFMCLAHLALKNVEYKKFYADRVAEGKFVILDNGTAEGSLVSFEELSKMIEEIHPSEVVIPDILHDGDASIKLADKFLTHLIKTRAINGSLRFMMAVQGNTLEEYIRAVDIVSRWGIINTIGASKFMFSNKGIDRALFLKVATTEHPEMNYHVLGLNSVDELRSIQQFRGVVRSVDSCYAALFAQNNSRMDTMHWRKKEFQFQFECFRNKYRANAKELEDILNAETADS